MKSDEQISGVEKVACFLREVFADIEEGSLHREW